METLIRIIKLTVESYSFIEGTGILQGIDFFCHLPSKTTITKTTTTTLTTSKTTTKTAAPPAMRNLCTLPKLVVYETRSGHKSTCSLWFRPWRNRNLAEIYDLAFSIQKFTSETMLSLWQNWEP